jgi:hypothetical protein
MAAKNYITIDDVREYMRDRTADDHELLTDVAWTDEEISRAMRTAAREFNSITPFSITVNPNHLPGDTNVFLDGIAVALFRRMRTNDGLNDLAYTAGSVKVDITGTRIGHLDRMIGMYDERFQSRAKEIKRAANLRMAFGAIG